MKNIDYATTLIDAAAGTIPEDYRALVCFLVLKVRKGVAKSIYYHYFEAGTEHNVTAHEGVRTDRYKLINFYNYDEFNLFDLKKEPSEVNNVANNPEYAGVLKENLKRLCDEYHEKPLRIRKGK